jgi:hypothetical protein
VKRLPLSRIEQAGDALETIPSMKAKIDDARAVGWTKYPSLFLADLDSTQIETVFAAIQILVDGASGTA